MVGLLHFNKILQISLIVLNEEYGLSYRELLEFFWEGRFDTLAPAEKKEGSSFPVLSESAPSFSSEPGTFKTEAKSIFTLPSG